MQHDTSLSLLDRLCRRSDQGAWKQLVEIYDPLLRVWLGRYQLPAADADDLIQDVLIVVANELPNFQHNRRPGSFRSWLRTILVNRLRNYWRSSRYRPKATGDSELARQLEQLEDPNSSLSRLWDQQHDRYVAERLLRSAQLQFSPTTWQVFWRVVMESADPQTVASELKLSINAVYIAKSRVLNSLRQLGAGLID